MAKTKRKRKQEVDNPRPEIIFKLKYGRVPSQEEVEHNPFAEFTDPVGYQGKIWQDVGEAITALWIKENPCTRPFGWWRYTDPGDIYPEPEDEADLLLELGQLTPSEIQILEERTK
jgi:hypothetical protein